VIIAIVPLAIVAEASYPYPQIRHVVTVLAAGALPGLYFGLTARASFAAAGCLASCRCCLLT
jgi:hypothetical protein